MTEEKLKALEKRLTSQELLPGHNSILVPVMIPDGITVTESGCLASEALALIAEVRRLQRVHEGCPPPYLQCETCGEINCCDGEWGEGSERTCLHCGAEGSMTSFTHPSGYWFWVLTQIYDEETHD